MNGFKTPPRWKGHRHGSRPLKPRLVVAYAAGKEPQKTAVDNVLRYSISCLRPLLSTPSCTAAPASKPSWSLNGRSSFRPVDEEPGNGDSRMANPVMWENENWPKQAQGVGLLRSSARRTGSFAVIENNRMKNYQMVVPTTWNASPRRERQPVTLRISLDRHTDTRCQSTA